MSRRLSALLLITAIVVALSFTWYQSRHQSDAAPNSSTDLAVLEEANDALVLEIETLEAEIAAIEDMNADTKRLLELKSTRLQALESQP